MGQSEWLSYCHPDFLCFDVLRIRKFSDHLFTTKTSKKKRRANFESGKCPPGRRGHFPLSKFALLFF